MDLNIKFDINDNQIVVTDFSSSYLEENNTTSYPLNQFRKSDTHSIIILAVNKLKEEEVINFSFKNSVEVNKDGWLKIYYLVLPTKEWFLEAKKIPNNLERYDIVYYISKNKIYWYQPKDLESGEVCKLEELLDIIKLPNIKTTVSVAEDEKVSICNLQKCYINLCQQIFENRSFTQCYNNNTIDSELIYKRDLVWMAINVIKYLAESNQLYEVERIVELLHSCNGVCGDKNIISNGTGCGCS